MPEGKDVGGPLIGWAEVPLVCGPQPDKPESEVKVVTKPKVKSRLSKDLLRAILVWQVLLFIVQSLILWRVWDATVQIDLPRLRQDFQIERSFNPFPGNYRIPTDEPKDIFYPGQSLRYLPKAGGSQSF